MFKNILSEGCRNILRLQGRRTFCQALGNCWKCNATFSAGPNILCSKCSSIQNIPKIDYFKLFDIDKQHMINLNELQTKFRNIQSQIHPDKFSGRSDTEQELSSEWSSFINKAYKILQSPLERGEYLLNLQGIKLPEENSISQKEFLMEIMEKNEEVEEAETNDELQTILQTLRDELSDLSSDFATRYQSGSFEDARKCLIKMKYLLSIEKSVKEKMLRS